MTILSILRSLSAPRPRYAFSALLLAAALALITACGNPQTSGASTTEASTPVTVTDVDGETRTIPAGKPAALFFFSVGCGECVGGAASLNKAAETLGSSADYLLVDMDPREPQDTIDAFRDYIKAPKLPAVIDTGAALTTRYQITSLSTLVVVDSKGNVTYRAKDPSADQIQAELTKAGAR